ncbi:MAG: hypothetical protein WB421_17840 [Terriglobales bacterium]
MADIDVTLQLIMLLKGQLPEKFLEDNIKLFRLFASGQIERIAAAANALPRDNPLIDAVKEHAMHEDGAKILPQNYSMINCEEATARRDAALALLDAAQNESTASAARLRIVTNELDVSNTECAAKKESILLEAADKKDSLNLAFAKAWLPLAEEVGGHDVFWSLQDGCRNVLKRKSDEMNAGTLSSTQTEPTTPVERFVLKPHPIPKTITEYLLSCEPPCRPSVDRARRIGIDVRMLFDQRYKGTKAVLKKTESVGGKNIPVNVYDEEDWDLIGAAWRNTSSSPSSL